MGQLRRRYDTAARRWAGIGPYYAMFPSQFADRVVREYTKRGHLVLDPFAGRGTSIFSAASQGRLGLGVEINPVGWVYARTKLRPASRMAVERRLDELGRVSGRYRRAAAGLPLFFRACYSPSVRTFLMAARSQLDWRRRKVDWTVMGLLLVYLHGKREASLSNQMRQTKSMSPGYAVRWWRKRGLRPPGVDPVKFIKARLAWRYANGRPSLVKADVYLGDSTRRIRKVQIAASRWRKRVRLLLTSPPYYGVTNYHYDQWLRLWLLGGRPNATRVSGKHRGKFEDRKKYRTLLRTVFRRASKLMSPDACVYVRTDRRKSTYAVTRAVLREVFPTKRLRRHLRPLRKPTQTRLFGDYVLRKGEVDLVLTPS